MVQGSAGFDVYIHLPPVINICVATVDHWKPYLRNIWNRKENVYSQLPTLDEVPLCEEPVRSIAPKEQAIWAQVVLSTAVTLTQPFWMWEAATGRSPKMLRLYVNHVWHLHQILLGTIVPRVYCCFSSEKTLQFPPNQTTLTWRYLNCQRKPAIPNNTCFPARYPQANPCPWSWSN